VARMTGRLRKRIEGDFPEPGSADQIVRIVSAAADSERVQAAIVLRASGDLGRLRDAVALTGRDWRDTLVGAGLAEDDWPEKLDAALGPATD
jgi:hypothetical protein